jgi:hypothetical protein
MNYGPWWKLSPPWTDVHGRRHSSLELGLRPLLSSRAPAKWGRWGLGIHFGLHRRVSGGEAVERQGGMVVVGALIGGALWCRRRGEVSR